MLTDKEKTLKLNGAIPLGLLNKGEIATIVEIVLSEKICKRVKDLGLREGKAIEVLNNDGRGLVLVRVDDLRIAIGRGMSMNILVRR